MKAFGFSNRETSLFVLANLWDYRIGFECTTEMSEPQIGLNAKIKVKNVMFYKADVRCQGLVTWPHHYN